MIENQKSAGIQVIKRAAAVLRTLRDAPDGMSLGQIGLKIDLPRSTVQRIVRALQDERMVTWSNINGGIVLGPEMRRLGAASRYDIVGECRLVLQEIGEATGETVDLSVMREDGMILLDQFSGTHRLRAATPVGEIFPLTSTANGRASLAQLPPMRLQDLLERNGVSASNIAALKPVVEAIRAGGLAYDLDDFTDGICAIGIGFTDQHGDIYSISVPIPRSRYADQRERVEQSLFQTRGTIERLMEMPPKLHLDAGTVTE